MDFYLTLLPTKYDLSRCKISIAFKRKDDPMQIRKYSLLVSLVHQMPQGASILSAQFQYDELMVWAMCDKGALPRNRGFAVIGTGWEIQNMHRLPHIASVIHPRHGAVWHVFDLGELSVDAAGKVKHESEENFQADVGTSAWPMKANDLTRVFKIDGR